MAVLRFIRFLRKTFITRHFRLAYGHFGEDVALERLMRETFDKNTFKSGVYVDVGAFHPTKYSNTYRFYKRGWKGVVIDIERDKLAAFKLRRPRDITIQAAISDKPGSITLYGDYFSPYTTAQRDVAAAFGRNDAITVKTQTLDQVLDATPFKDREIDLLDIDCEGMDYQVLCSLDFTRYRPKIVVIEIHAASIAEVMEKPAHALLSRLSYIYVSRIGPTSVFVRGDLIKNSRPPPGAAIQE